MTNQEDESASPHLMELLGEPALLKREDATIFRRLKREIENHIKPQNILDEMRVMDITNSVWESQRFRRHLVSLVDGERAHALSRLLLPFLGRSLPAASDLAKNYCSNDENEKAAASKLVKQYGITDDHIEAQAVVLNSDSFNTLNRGIVARDTTRRTMLKEISREKRRAEKYQRRNKRSEHNDNQRDAAVTKPAIPKANAS